MTTEPAQQGFALATERLWETHWPHFLIVSTVAIVGLAAVLSPLLLLLGVPELGLWRSFTGVAKLLFFIVPMVVILRAGQPGAQYLKRTICRFDVFEDRVEVYDGADVRVGDTRDGSLRVTRSNVRIAKGGLIGAVMLDYRGGSVTVSPTESVGAFEGLPASTGSTWRTVPDATYRMLLRYAV